MADKCIYCYRPLGTHTHDPILLPNGAKYDWISDTELVYEPDVDNRWYKGFQVITEDEVIELQEELQTLETENGITPLTVFSPLNTSGKFQITGKHIKEMRNSVEKLLIAMGLTKTDYFNYDEEGNHIIHPLGDKIEWTDPITNAIDLQKFQVKYIHIEDLRHFIQTLWLERFNIVPIQSVWNFVGTSSYGKYLDFVGDMLGTHRIGTIATTYTGAIIETSGFFIDDGSVISTKPFMNLYIAKGVQESYSGDITNFLYINILKPNGIIMRFDTNTNLTFNSEITLSGISYDVGYVGLVLIASAAPTYRQLIYYFGTPGSVHPQVKWFSLTKSEMENFNRNPYNDFCSIWGYTPPSGLIIFDIMDFREYGYISSGSGIYKEININFSFDNIQISKFK